LNLINSLINHYCVNTYIKRHLLFLCQQLSNEVINFVATDINMNRGGDVQLLRKRSAEKVRAFWKLAPRIENKVSTISFPTILSYMKKGEYFSVEEKHNLQVHFCAIHFSHFKVLIFFYQVHV
jgi:phage terminase large subunit-like protein